MRGRVAQMVGGPFDGETRRIQPARKIVYADGEKRHVYRPSGQKGVWSYDMESSMLETLAAEAERRARREAELDSAVDENEKSR